MTSAAMSVDFGSSLAAGSVMNSLSIEGSNDAPDSPKPGRDIFCHYLGHDSPGWTCECVGNSAEDYLFACKDVLGNSLLVGKNEIGGFGEEKRCSSTDPLKGSLFQAENVCIDRILDNRNATSCEEAGPQCNSCSIFTSCWDAKEGKVVDAHREMDCSNVGGHLFDYNLELCGVTLAHKSSSNDYATKDLPEMLGYAVGYLTGVFVQLMLIVLLVRCMVRRCQSYSSVAATVNDGIKLDSMFPVAEARILAAPMANAGHQYLKE